MQPISESSCDTDLNNEDLEFPPEMGEEEAITLRLSLMDLTPEKYLKKMECPVCLDIALPPIWICTRGHILCDQCRRSIHGPTSSSCWTTRCYCSAEFPPMTQGSRNFALESFVMDSVLKCDFDGCPAILHGARLRRHRLGCGFRPIGYEEDLVTKPMRMSELEEEEEEDDDDDTRTGIFGCLRDTLFGTLFVVILKLIWHLIFVNINNN